jgi:formylglycine-generating enzyme required for sulfatase activity
MGKVWEWLADCYQDSYANAPTDGSALMYEGCEIRSIRGGSSAYNPAWLRSAARSDDPPDALFDGIGFRIARDL